MLQTDVELLSESCWKMFMIEKFFFFKLSWIAHLGNILDIGIMFFITKAVPNNKELNYIATFYA